MRNEDREALRYLEMSKTLQDSVFTAESARQINEFEVKYETEKIDKANQLLIKENELRRRRQQTATGVIVALVLLSFTLLWAFVLKRKSLLQSRELFAKETELSQLKMKAVEKQNSHLQELLFAEEEIKRLQAKTLEQKNNELTSASMLIANKNEIFERLKKLAEEIKCEVSGDMNEKVKEIITEIDRQTDVEMQWEQFRTRFESVHKSFFDKLRKNEGALTQNDLQLCAYIKLNLTTKEIARLMNISPESVNTSRYRLRKKLNLTNHITLDEFIHKL
jgi:DNA-binding CsgD family transcriptional regulator